MIKKGVVLDDFTGPVGNLYQMMPGPKSRHYHDDPQSPAIRVEDVLENTQWELKISDDLKEISTPSVEEIRILREALDPEGLFLKKNSCDSSAKMCYSN